MLTTITRRISTALRAARETLYWLWADGCDALAAKLDRDAAPTPSATGERRHVESEFDGEDWIDHYTTR